MKGVVSNEETGTGENVGLTAEDALRDARTHGYRLHYDKGFCHGAIIAGVGCIVGGLIDMAITRNEQKKVDDKLRVRAENAYLKKLSLEAKAENEKQAREDNND